MKKYLLPFAVTALLLSGCAHRNAVEDNPEQVVQTLPPSIDYSVTIGPPPEGLDLSNDIALERAAQESVPRVPTPSLTSPRKAGAYLKEVAKRAERVRQTEKSWRDMGKPEAPTLPLKVTAPAKPVVVASSSSSQAPVDEKKKERGTPFFLKAASLIAVIVGLIILLGRMITKYVV